MTLRQGANGNIVDSIIAGAQLMQPLYVVTKLLIPQLLAQRPMSAEELAAITDSDADTLYRILRALANVGLFTENADKLFSLTSESQRLMPGMNGAIWPVVIGFGEEHYEASGGLLNALKSGTTAFDNIFGMTFYDYLARHPDAAERFDLSQINGPSQAVADLMRFYDFDDAGIVADIGAGIGGCLAELLTQNKLMRAIHFDLPHVTERAQVYMTQRGVADRCEFIGGDFLKAAPGNVDTYFLRHIVHNWSDEKAIQILSNVRSAMHGRAKVLCIEHVLPGPGGYSFSKLLDIGMLTLHGGRERTAAEFDALYSKAGLRLYRMTSIGDDLCLMESHIP